jgi:hypothetical protein
METKIKAFKTELKKISAEIKVARNEFKECQRSNPNFAYVPEEVFIKKKFECRHKHITYCLLRGTPYEKIENPRKGNEPCWDTIEKLKGEYSYA